MLQEIEKYVLDEYKVHIIYSTEAIELMIKYNKLFEEWIVPIWKETGLRVPFPEIGVVDKDEIGGLEFVYNNRNYILVFSGTIIKHRLYLEEVFAERNISVSTSYIDKLLEYTIMFVIMHEYMHIYCGHHLKEKSDRITQEIEADIEAFIFMVKKIMRDTEMENVGNELIDCFVAIFYFFRNLENQMFSEQYNIKLFENYYEEKDRDHPLTSQRIMCIYRYFNVFLYYNDEKKFSNIKDEVISKLLELGEKKTENERKNMLYLLVEESIDKMQKSVDELRRKIPRVGALKEL